MRMVKEGCSSVVGRNPRNTALAIQTCGIPVYLSLVSPSALLLTRSNGRMNSWVGGATCAQAKIKPRSPATLRRHSFCNVHPHILVPYSHAVYLAIIHSRSTAKTKVAIQYNQFNKKYNKIII